MKPILMLPRRQYQTNRLLGSLLLAFAILAMLVWLTNCAPRAFTNDRGNPLEEPGYTEPTQDELHVENIREITHNPAYHH